MTDSVALLCRGCGFRLELSGSSRKDVLGWLHSNGPGWCPECGLPMVAGRMGAG